MILCLLQVNCYLANMFALIGGQTGLTYWGTNSLPLLGDKWDVLIGGQTGCPYWGQAGWPYWGTNGMSLLGDKQVALRLQLLRAKQVIHNIGGQTGCPLLEDK